MDREQRFLPYHIKYSHNYSNLSDFIGYVWVENLALSFWQIWIDRSLSGVHLRITRLSVKLSRDTRDFNLSLWPRGHIWPQYLHTGTRYVGILMRLPCSLQPLVLSNQSHFTLRTLWELSHVSRKPMSESTIIPYGCMLKLGWNQAHKNSALVPGSNLWKAILHIYEGTNRQPEWVCRDRMAVHYVRNPFFQLDFLIFCHSLCTGGDTIRKQ